jgi:hypothetical protein
VINIFWISHAGSAQAPSGLAALNTIVAGKVFRPSVW